MQSSVEGTVTEEDRAQIFISKQSRYLELLRSCIPGSSLEAEHGSSDARYLSGLDIDGVVWGADGRMSQHSDSERVLIPSIEFVYRCLLDFVKKVSSGNH